MPAGSGGFWQGCGRLQKEGAIAKGGRLHGCLSDTTTAWVSECMSGLHFPPFVGNL